MANGTWLVALVIFAVLSGAFSSQSKKDNAQNAWTAIMADKAERSTEEAAAVSIASEQAKDQKGNRQKL